MAAPSRIELNDAHDLAELFHVLHEERRDRMHEARQLGLKRQVLGRKHRNTILGKTDGHCHFCGGKIPEADKWAVDHVLAHAKGGNNSVDNYLPAHTLCNTYRWYYGSEELQLILKLGVWLHTRIEKKDRHALVFADEFVRYEKRRQSRRRSQK